MDGGGVSSYYLSTANELPVKTPRRLCARCSCLQRVRLRIDSLLTTYCLSVFRGWSVSQHALRSRRFIKGPCRCSNRHFLNGLASLFTDFHSRTSGCDVSRSGSSLLKLPKYILNLNYDPSQTLTKLFLCENLTEIRKHYTKGFVLVILNGFGKPERESVYWTWIHQVDTNNVLLQAFDHMLNPTAL